MHVRKVRPNKTKPAMGKAATGTCASAIDLLHDDNLVNPAGSARRIRRLRRWPRAGYTVPKKAEAKAESEVQWL